MGRSSGRRLHACEGLRVDLDLARKGATDARHLRPSPSLAVVIFVCLRRVGAGAAGSYLADARPGMRPTHPPHLSLPPVGALDSTTTTRW